ncbi:MAG: gliding motility-associated C-terminal domain-containing protein [Bacteroidota bacterium]|nr:gliding motility-associated C-terminal domain-containing protein [Bacteroidota bacterium]
MKKNINLLLITMLMFFYFQSFEIEASHILGSELTYKNVIGNRYKFQLKVYRDCKECKFNGIGGGTNSNNCNEVPNLIVRESMTNNILSNQLGQIELSRVGIKDITPICNTVSSKCSFNGGNSSFGFEEQLFEGYFDFTNLLNQSLCKFDISISISSRNNKINTAFAEQNFFNYTFINLCNGQINSTVDFNQIPKFINLNNQPNFLSLGVVNPDGDSLSFKLGKALVNRLASVNYGSGRGHENPFTFYCPNSQLNCVSNSNVTPGNPVHGFCFSQSTGDIAFTPIINNQGGVIVVECEEWRKDVNSNYVLVGLTRRDIFSEVVDINNNLPLIYNNFNDNVKICEGENKTIRLSLFDLPNIGGVIDTLDLEIIQSTPGVTLNKVPINSAPFFNYFLNIEHNGSMYGKSLITLEVSDNHCDLKGTNSKSLTIDFLKNRNFKISHVIKNCDELIISPEININENVYWEILNINGDVLAQSYSRKINYRILNGGFYIIKAKLQSQLGFCEMNIIDTIQLNDILKPSIKFNGSLMVCQGTELIITPSEFKATENSLLYVNNQSIAQFPYKLVVNENIDLNFKVIQDNGCLDLATQKVLLMPKLKILNKDLTFCLNDFDDEVVLPKPIIENANLLRSYDLIGNRSFFDFYKLPDDRWSIHLKEKRSLVSTLMYLYIDTNNCVLMDTLNIQVIDTPHIDIKLFEPTCINNFPIELPGYDKGVWSSNSNGSLIENGRFLSVLDSVSSVQLFYQKSDFCSSKKSYLVAVLDTSSINLAFPNQLKLCENSDKFELQASPSGGLWFGEKIVGNKFYLTNLVENMYEFKYLYQNPNGCFSSVNGQILIDRIPQFFIQSSRDSICYGDVLSLQAFSEDTLNGYWYTDGLGRIDKPNQMISQYFPSKDDINIGFINLSYTMQSDNSCGNISKSIKVFIKDGPKGEIFINSNNNQCEPSLHTFNSSFKNVEQQKWFVNDSLIDDFDYAFPSKILLRAGDYSVKTIVRDGACFVTSFSSKFTVLPTPKIKYYSNPNERLSIEMPRLFLKDQSYCKYGHEVKWLIDDSLISKDREFSIMLDKPIGTFNLKLIATSLKGSCTDSIQKKYYISSIQQLFIPDAFSPDTKGPDDNNVFRVYGPPMKKFEIEIFNRFGEKVYISNNQNESWDGTYKRQICMPGVYFYKIVTKDSDGIDRDYSGTVTLIR